MGGLLSAELVLLDPRPPPGDKAFRHRVLGTINFDVPFLGMHPGVVTSGLASIFRSDSSPPGTPQPSVRGDSAPLTAVTTTATDPPTEPSRTDTLFATPSDPNYNPKFANDINIPIRKGWRSTMHFITKHSDGLRTATKQYVKSHVEFGGAMADYRGLHARYNKLRSLEDTEEELRRRETNKSEVSHVPRVRFVNYYTACHGVPKKKKPENENSNAQTFHDKGTTPSQSSLDVAASGPRLSMEEELNNSRMVSVSPTPLEESSSPSDRLVTASKLDRDEVTDSNDDEAELRITDSRTTADSPLDVEAVSQILGSIHVQMPIWPPLSPEPARPSAPNLDMHEDKHVKSALKKEHDRKLKQWKAEMKDRESTLAERKEVEEKIRKSAAKEMQKKSKVKDDKSLHQQSFSASSSSLQRTTTDLSKLPSSSRAESERTRSPQSRSIAETSESKESKQKDVKDRRFCVIPSKRPDGTRDSTWIRVFMHDVDEVGAHCGLFLPNKTYERLVGDVGSQIEEWVRARKS